MGCVQSRSSFDGVRKEIDGKDPVLVGTLYVQHETLPVCQQRHCLLVDGELQFEETRIALGDIKAVMSDPDKYEVILHFKTGKQANAKEQMRFRARTAAEFEVWVKALHMEERRMAEDLCSPREEESVPYALRRARKNSMHELRRADSNFAGGAEGKKLAI